MNSSREWRSSGKQAKLMRSRLRNRIIDRRLQLLGGNDYTTHHVIGPACIATRISAIYAGTSEIMKTIISGDLLT